MLELLNDKNPNIRQIVNSILEVVQLHDDMWKQQIKTRKFQVHNQVYLQLMEEYEQKYAGDEEAAAYYDYYYGDGQEGIEVGEDGEEYDSEDNHWYDNNDLAQRIWEERDEAGDYQGIMQIN